MSANAAAAVSGGDGMETEKEILENRAQIRLLESKIDALKELLSREGIIDEEEFEDLWKDLIKSRKA